MTDARRFRMEDGALCVACRQSRDVRIFALESSHWSLTGTSRMNPRLPVLTPESTKEIL